MKRMVFILMGLMLVVLFALSGCQKGTEHKAGMADCLKITAEGAPVEVQIASDGQYSYEYDKEKYTVTTTTNGSTFEIKVAEIESGADTGEQSNVIVCIPDQSYTLITGVSEGSSLILPAINADITVTSNASSVMLSLPSDYNKTLNFAGNASSCLLSMSNINDFAVSAKVSASSVSVPNGWPVYDMLSSDYNYTDGNGTAKINIDVTGSSIVINHNEEEIQESAEIQVIGDPAEGETDSFAENIEIVPEVVEADWSDYFNGLNGTAVVYDAAKRKYTMYNHDLAMTRSSPCSTFKIISSLIALENGIIEPENSTRTWSGEIFWNEDWNKDIDFHEAFRTSCVWYYRHVIDDIGEDLMQRELNSLQYGNYDISDWEGRLNTNNSNRALTGFWIESSLMISPKEQVEVMERIFGKDSDYSEETQNELKQVMLVPESESTDISIYGKTGMGKTNGIVVDAWFTGFAESAAGDIYLCVRLGRTDGMDVSSSLAKEIAIKVITDYCE